MVPVGSAHTPCNRGEPLQKSDAGSSWPEIWSEERDRHLGMTQVRGRLLPRWPSARLFSRRKVAVGHPCPGGSYT
jgi:hypothetical protein